MKQFVMDLRTLQKLKGARPHNTGNVFEMRET